jgi:ABC-type lipoprotein export system ATPase subunit
VTAIEARDVFHVYESPEGNTAALRGLTLAIDEGQITAILGPSGSGKSTLLRLLAGLEQPSAGSLRVFGQDLAAQSRRRRADYRSRQLGYVEQHYWRSLDPHLGARELVALQSALAGVPRRRRLEHADELLARVGLGDRADARPAELSGGEQQRVAVCAALVHRPRLLLTDEPTGELDRENALLTYDLLAELVREQGCTAVVVTHDPAVAGIADRVVRMRDGRVSGESVAGGASGREEAIVVGRGGWLRLPEDLLLRAGIGARAHASVEGGRIVVTTADGDGAAQPGAGAERVTPTPPRPGAVAVEAQGVTKTVGRGVQARTLFERLDLAVPAGSVLVLTGPSGSGKTTLLALLGGLAAPDDGEVVALGSPLSGLDRAERAAFRREHVAVIGQQPGLVPFLTALENVELALALKELPSGEASARAAAALEAVGLGDRLRLQSARLSAGERQRVAVARALAGSPRIVLADEPTARLDEANALGVASLLRRAAEEHGAAVVCATHDALLAGQADAELSLVVSPLVARIA